MGCPGLVSGKEAAVCRLDGSWWQRSKGGGGRAGREVVQQRLASVPPAVVAVLSLEAVVKLLSGAEAQPHELQQLTVCHGLLGVMSRW